MHKSFKTRVTRHPSGGYHIVVPVRMAYYFLSNGHKRVICTFDKHKSFHSALRKYQKDQVIISLSKSKMKQADLRAGDLVDVRLEVDRSAYQYSMPEEWLVMLEEDKDGSAIFEQLTPGKKRSILHMVGSPKKSETRISRALKIMQNLKSGIRNPQDFLKSVKMP